VDAGKIKLIYNGVPPVKKLSEPEKIKALAVYGVSDGALVISQPARFSPTKGQDVVLDAAGILNKKSFTFILAGDGPEHPRIAQRIVNEGISNVTLPGFLPDTTALLNISFAQINASTDGAEATSLALLEGMSSGIPAVVSDTGGNPYVIEHEVNGLVVPERDPEALAKALTRLRDDPALYRRLSEGARRVYRERFTAERMVTDTEAVYAKLVTNRRGDKRA
jgi:glycosyltransferase involved in cell wall biosynthesis